MHGGNKKAVHTVKSIQDSSDRAGAEREVLGDVGRSEPSCTVAVISIKGQKASEGRHVGACSAVTVCRVRQHLKPLTFPDGNKEWCSPSTGKPSTEL